MTQPKLSIAQQLAHKKIFKNAVRCKGFPIASYIRLMTVDYIIIGQGICGTFLSWNLVKEGKSVVVIDEANHYSSSKVASGVLNPVTGRRVVTVWMANELFPFCKDIYTQVSQTIGVNVIEQKNTISFANSVQMLEGYRKRAEEENSYISAVTNKEAQAAYFNFVFDCFEINPTYLINLPLLLSRWRNQLQASSSLLEEKFDDSLLQFSGDGVQYKNFNASRIIFCNGVKTFESAYWKNLPYVYNKGEVLIAEIPGLPATNIYKFGPLTIVPWKNNLWWVGSTYENEFETAGPTEQFKNAFAASLKSVLKIPFTIVDHMAAIRPAAVERRPFVGLHPYHPALGILNGMGTKGCSIGPWFAKQLTDHLLHGTTIDPLADTKRFNRILKDV